MPRGLLRRGVSWPLGPARRGTFRGRRGDERRLRELRDARPGEVAAGRLRLRPHRTARSSGIEATWTRHAPDTPKSAAGFRTIALGSRLAEELFQHRARSAFTGEDERVFCNPFRAYDRLLRDALERVGIEDEIRPCHDLRHSSITNAAARGYSSYSTTRRYTDLAGERFRAEADRLERRLWAVRYQEPVPSPPLRTPHRSLRRCRMGLVEGGGGI
jgi:hypothetical protein